MPRPTGRKRAEKLRVEEYVCLGCGRPFREPVSYEEPSTGERLLLSPCCGEAFREGRRCPECGALMEEEDRELCARCAREAVERFRRLLERFTPEEREVINDAYDGVALTEPGSAA